MVTLVSLMLFSSAGIWLTQSQNIVNLPAEFSRLGSGDLISFYFGEKVEATIKRRDILSFVTYPMVIAAGARASSPRSCCGAPSSAATSTPSAATPRPPRSPACRSAASSSSSSSSPASARPSPRSSTPARLGGGRPTIGAGACLLDIIGATVIGGTSLAGGKGKIVWTFIGVVFFVLLGNTLNYMGLSAFYIDVVKGGIILAAAALDVAAHPAARERGRGMSDADPRARRHRQGLRRRPCRPRRRASRSAAAASSAWSGRTAPARAR